MKHIASAQVAPNTTARPGSSSSSSIKGHTPDKGADTPGGTINRKTRSPLNLREKRRISYSATMRAAPSFTEQIPLRAQHRAHPLLNLGYQEVFDTFQPLPRGRSQRRLFPDVPRHASANQGCHSLPQHPIQFID